LKVLLNSKFIWGRAHTFGVLLAVACVTCADLGARAQDAAANIDIGKNEIGAPPADFDLFPPGGTQNQWTVVRDATAGSAIEHSGVISSEDRSPLAIYKPALLKNADISVRFKSIGGRANQGGGVALRVMTPDTYYLVRADARRDRVLFLRSSNGETEEIAGVDADIADSSWHTLAIRAEDDRFTVSLDGVWLFTGFDKTLSRAGRIALWTKSDSVTRFDSIAITPLPAAEERY
jgi:hypothetical protein